MKRIVLIATLGGLMLFLALAGLSILSKQIGDRLPATVQHISSSYKPKATEQEVSPGMPVRLKIPKISVDAALEYVGITSKGELDVPKRPVNAAWYDRGPRPGEIGSSVIDGHYGWVNKILAVFNNLHKLQKGDNLYVEDEKGVTTTFVVRELRTYLPSEDDSAVFISSDGKAHLNLITCQGVWNKAKQSYPNRLTVFTDKEKS